MAPKDKQLDDLLNRDLDALVDAGTKKAKKKKGMLALLAVILMLAVAGAIVIPKFILPNLRYNSAIKLFEEKQYSEAYKAFERISSVKDAAFYANCCLIEQGIQRIIDGNIGPDLPSLLLKEGMQEYTYNRANELFEEHDYDSAEKLYSVLYAYLDSKERIDEIQYINATDLLEKKEYRSAYDVFSSLGDYSDSKTKAEECLEALYQNALAYYNNKDFDASNEEFRFLSSHSYRNSAELIHLHQFDTETVIKEPTCDQTGSKEKSCSCGKIEIETIPAIGHKYSVRIIENPTCTKTGVSENRCLVCGHVEQSAVVPALGHNYADSVTLQATCEKEGIRTYTCFRCGDHYTETIAPIGHNWNAATCQHPETCKNCGLTRGEKAAHQWNSWGTCKVCYEKYVKATVLFSESPFTVYARHMFSFDVPPLPVSFSITSINTWIALNSDGSRPSNTSPVCDISINVSFGADLREYSNGNVKVPLKIAIVDDKGNIIDSKSKLYRPSNYHDSINTSLNILENGTFHIVLSRDEDLSYYGYDEW